MNYTIKELCAALVIKGKPVSEKTIFRWIDLGLEIVARDKKQILIMGSAVKEFLRKKDAKKKVKLKRCEFYCLTCKAARTAKRGTIRRLKNRKTGECRVCRGKLSRTFQPSQKD